MAIIILTQELCIPIKIYKSYHLVFKDKESIVGQTKTLNSQSSLESCIEYIVRPLIFLAPYFTDHCAASKTKILFIVSSKFITEFIPISFFYFNSWPQHEFLVVYVSVTF